MARGLLASRAVQHLSEVVDFEVLIARDEELAAQEGTSALVARDKALGSQLKGGPPQRRMRAWLEARRVNERDLPGARASLFVRLAGWVLGLIGFAIGVSTASALLAYDGKTPVNVLAWLVGAAGLPFLLALVLVIGLLVPRAYAPWGGLGQSLVASVLEPLLRRLPGNPRWTEVVLGRGARGGHDLEKWLVMVLTQVFSLAFTTAVIVTLVLKVIVSDLTFGWGTTLDLDDPEVAAIVGVVSSPWSGALPGAVPDEEAVRQSNYRRFVDRFRDTEHRAAVPTEVSARWWRFCAIAVLFYGVLPRVLLLMFSVWRWRAALARWPRTDRPSVHALLERLDGKGGAFEVRAENTAAPGVLETEAPDLPLAPGDSGSDTQPASPADSGPPPLVVAWGSAAAQLGRAARALGLEEDGVLTAGADLDLSAEEAVLEEAASRKGPVRVLIPLTEPPIEDVLTFLRELRSVAPIVTVVPLTAEGGEWRPARADSIWSKALGRVRGVTAEEA